MIYVPFNRRSKRDLRHVAFTVTLEPMNRAWFTPGTKGARGVCSANGCIRNARSSYLTPDMDTPRRLACCELHVPQRTDWCWEFERRAMDARRRKDYAR